MSIEQFTVACRQVIQSELAPIKQTIDSLNTENFSLLQRVFNAVDAHRAEFGLRTSGGPSTSRQQPTNTTIASQQSTSTPTIASQDGTEQRKAYNHLLRSKHDCFLDLYDEWYGAGRFQDCPVSGGIAACEQRWGVKWRNKVNAMRISRQKNMAQAFRAQLESSLEGLEGDHRASARQRVLNQWEDWYKEVGKNIPKMYALLQSKGICKKGKDRGIKRRRPLEEAN